VHEMGIASSLLEALETEARRFPGARLAKAGLRVGELAGVDRDALSFCFEAITRGTPWETLVLEIEYCPRRQRCQRCAAVFAVQAYEFACPFCGSDKTDFAGGDELELSFLEVEEDEPCPAGTQSPEGK
jgi:hydrogenase nickel incorporation protein HypA/HybF